jgi:predicted permease
MDATRRYVSDEFFDVLRIRLLAGRTFVDTDGQVEEEDPPVVINEALARQYFPGEDPLGKTLVFDYDIIRNLEVVGVVADIRESDPGTDPFPTFYLPARWRPRLNMNVFVRTQGDPPDLSAALRHAVRSVDPDIPIPSVRTLEARLAESLFQPRFRSVLVSLFALIAVVLSVIGLYGVLACFVRGRTHEIGIRLALGAGTRGTAGLVLWQGAILVGSGILVGLAGSFAGARVLQSWLFGVAAMDPLTYTGVSLLLALAGLSACLVPTARALRLDPVEVLKAE